MTLEDADRRHRAAVQASLDALLAGATMLEAMAAADTVMADGRPRELARPGV